MPFGTGIGLGLQHFPMDGGGSAFVPNTVFVSSAGDDSTGEVGREDLPFLTLEAALAALAATVPTAQTTAVLVNDVSEGPVPVPLILVEEGLVIQGQGSVRSVADYLVLPDGAMLELVLQQVSVNLRFTSTPSANPNWGTIQVSSSAEITDIDGAGSGGGNGGNGPDGGNDTGNNGANGADGDPPTNGSPGEAGAADGGEGVTGGDGRDGWSFILDGSVTVATANLSGGNGGDGGLGGAGGIATGGVGGTGGNWVTPDGGPNANGGDGGNATASGGRGGHAGNGGDGGFATLINGAAITSFTAPGGIAGSLNTGGAAGTAVGGIGGLRGSNGNFGTGNDGAVGSITADPGADGNPGVNGNDGGIL